MTIINALSDWTMKTPQKFGVFHIIFLLLTIVSSVYLIVYHRNCSEKKMKQIIFVSWIILVFFGICKILIMSNENGVLKYNWGAFPFQFCESPLYVIPLLLIAKNKKIQHALISFFATYIFFAGFAIMVYPDNMFSSRVLLSIRTMYQHGLQVVLGLFLFAWDRKNLNLKTFFSGIIVFFIFVTIAIIINTTIGKAVAPEYSVNMFFISKDYPTELMILKRIQPHVPWIIFLMLYIVSFTSLALGSFVVESGICQQLAKRQLAKENEFKYNN